MDWRKLGPYALAAVVVTLLPFRLAPAAGGKTEPPAAPPADAAAARGSEAGELPPPPPGPGATARTRDLLGEYLGDLALARDPRLPLPLAPGTDLEVLLVTVPDPLDTTLALDFDLALDGLQRGFAAEDFLLDRFSLPWFDASAKKDHGYRREPGALLFRSNGPPARLVLVFVIGETPRQGVHAGAFDAAVASQREIERRAGAPARPLTLVSPYFSGSVDSLARALGRNHELGATIVTGTATAADLDEPFARLATGAHLERAVPEDRQLLAGALCALRDRLSLRRRSVALLVEADTAYGANLADLELGCDLEPLIVPFSGRLSSLRAALGRKVKSPAEDARTEVELGKGPGTELELDLTAPGRAVDVLGELSPDAADLDDLALANLIRNLSVDGYRFVGLVSTDPMDKLYLGWRLHQLAPDLLLFTFNNSLLYAHPQAGAALDGTLVVSATPLVPDEPRAGQRQQLATETQAGLLRATRAVLTRDPAQRTERLAEGRRFGWIVAIGGGSLWPIVTVPLEGARAGEAPPKPIGVCLGGRVILCLGAVLALLGFAAGWLHRSAPPRDGQCPEQRRAIGGEPGWQARWLLAGGLALLAGAGWVTIVLVLLSVGAVADGRVRLDLALLGAAAIYTLGIAALLRIAAALRSREPHPVTPRALPGGEKTWIPAGLVLLPLAGRLLVSGWTGDQVDTRYFFQRAITVTSGLSPLVALGFLGLGLFGWFLLQMKRLRVSARHAVPFPRPHLSTGVEELAGAADLADGHVAPLLTGAFPAAANRRFWGALGGLVLVVVSALAPRHVVRPLTETAGYGRFFLFLVLAHLVLGALSWYRYLRLWRELKRTLSRLPASLLERLVSPDAVRRLDWNPMGSFAWTLPKLRMAQIIAEEAERRLPDGPRRESVHTAQRELLAAEANYDFAAEVAARRELQRVWAELEAERAADGEWRDFHAFRLAAYLRYAFAILRNQLLTTVWLGLAALGAVSFYDYHPRYVLTLAVTGALVGLALVVLVSFYQMETDPALSAFAGVEPTKVKSWRQLLLNLLSYALLPLLALLASRIPLLGELLRQIGNPLLQSLGGS